MKHIDKAPEDAQKSLIRALIKELIIHDDHIDVKMYIGQPESMLEAHIESECADTSTKRKRPADITTSEALTNHTQNTYDCQQWLPGRISWGTLVCSKCAIQFQKAPKNSIRLIKLGPKLPTNEMNSLWTNLAILAPLWAAENSPRTRLFYQS